ncbi:MAG: transposase [Gemmatimonadota bacterium]|nr:transposase [Gemmatimonadota bacterium]
MRVFKYKLYRNRRQRRLAYSIGAYASVWNHFIALHRRYYQRTGRYLPKYRAQLHLTRLKKTRRFGWWRQLDAQACQDVIERIDRAYVAFFNQATRRPPKFRSGRLYSSFTLKQAGYQLTEGALWLGKGNNKQRFSFFQSRPVEGTIRRITIRRDRVGDVWISVLTDADEEVQVPRLDRRNSAGADFGLKTFLTLSDGTRIQSPRFLFDDPKQLRRASQAVSSKRPVSGNRRRARLALARLHRKAANRRAEFHWQTAHWLCDRYDRLVLEDLNLRGMARLWGRKVHDLGFGDFLLKLGHIAAKKGTQIVFADRWYPSTKTCSACDTQREIDLSERVFECEHCGHTIDRDLNAARNLSRWAMPPMQETA